mmetsp:Transcript_8295/g.14212  ORF Transcript_8295/g.14212 Transcript_8295/m.14212 type:complete len:218 (-) Transcript_8295:74-727(-)
MNLCAHRQAAPPLSALRLVRRVAFGCVVSYLVSDVLLLGVPEQGGDLPVGNQSDLVLLAVRPANLEHLVDGVLGVVDVVHSVLEGGCPLELQLASPLEGLGELLDVAGEHRAVLVGLGVCLGGCDQSGEGDGGHLFVPQAHLDELEWLLDQVEKVLIEILHESVPVLVRSRLVNLETRGRRWRRFIRFLILLELFDFLSNVFTVVTYGRINNIRFLL